MIHIIFLSWFRQNWCFSLEKAILWIMNSYLSRKQWFEDNNVLMMDLYITKTDNFWLHKLDLMDCSCVDYCDVFISCLNTHSDGTHSLQWIHWWASDGMLHLSKSVPMMKKGEYILSTFSADFLFLVNYSFKPFNILQITIISWNITRTCLKTILKSKIIHLSLHITIVVGQDKTLSD